jgi:hypothetical protein
MIPRSGPVNPTPGKPFVDGDLDYENWGCEVPLAQRRRWSCSLLFAPQRGCTTGLVLADAADSEAERFLEVRNAPAAKELRHSATVEVDDDLDERNKHRLVS